MKKSILKRWAKSEGEIPVHEETFILTMDGKEQELDLIHNFNFFNLDICKALNEWAAQTDDRNIVDFSRFLMGETNGEIKLVCISKADWVEFQSLTLTETWD